jgi:hypothetical protein
MSFFGKASAYFMTKKLVYDSQHFFRQKWPRNIVELLKLIG